MLGEAFAYKRWATQRTLAAAGKLTGDAHATTLAFVRQQLNHLRIVEEMFRARLLGEAVPHAATNTTEVPELAELSQRLEHSQHWYDGYVATITPAQLQETIAFDFADGRRGCMRREEILFHVITHGNYHRGAIGHALDRAQVARPADTYTVFIHEAEPARRLAG